MPESEFLVVDLPAEGLVLARHTAAIPGSEVDSIREDLVGADPRTESSHLVLLQGFSEPQFRAVLADMRRLYPGITVLTEQPASRRWVLRNRVKMDEVAAKQMLFLGRAETEFGLYWTHIRDGKFQLRAEVRSHESALEDVERLRAVFRTAGVPADVRLAALGEGDTAVSRLLRDLVTGSPR